MKKKLLLIALMASLSSSVFAYTNNFFLEAAAGIAWLQYNSNVISDKNVFAGKLGGGYLANFSKESTFFWGADVHYVNYDGKMNNADASLILGGDLGKDFGLYIKAGTEYFGEAGKYRPKGGLGLSYDLSEMAQITFEVNGTNLASNGNNNVSMGSALIGARFFF